MKKILLLIVVLMALTACQKTKVDEGHVRDMLFSVEPARSGSYSIFLTNDQALVYCTNDPDLGEKALDLLVNHHGEVYLTFKTKDFLKDAEGEAFGVDECQSYFEFTTVILTHIEGVAARNQGR